VGIVGIGGLGTMGIKIAKALGHQVVAISTSEKKKEMALQKGANSFVVSTDPESIKALTHKCDIILNTVSVPHDLNVYLQLLNYNGILVQLGGVIAPHTISQFPLMAKRHTISGSFIGGTQATQEVIDLCFKHNIYPDIQIIEAKDIDFAWKKLCEGKNDDGLRYVIDIKKSLLNKDFMVHE
jgi:alcohol dehydrogenase (NADP+)